MHWVADGAVNRRLSAALPLTLVGRQGKSGRGDPPHSPEETMRIEWALDVSMKMLLWMQACNDA